MSDARFDSVGDERRVNGIQPGEQFIFIQFVNTNGEETGTPVSVPCSSSVSDLTDILIAFREKELEGLEAFTFFIGETQILDDLGSGVIQSAAARLLDREGIGDAVAESGALMESIVKVTYQAQAVFCVKPVTRCTGTLPGHKGAVLVALFSPDARALATGSGDCSVRFWDLNTELPQTLVASAHQSPVLCLSWSPDGLRLASGCQGGLICLWKQDKTGNWALDSPSPLIQPALNRTPTNSRARWIRSLVWRPFHLDKDCRLLAAAYQETSIVIWDTVTGRPHRILTGHEKPVTSLRWGGTDLLYSASQDRTIRVWRCTDGALCRRLDLHGHWVNCLALSVDYVLRTGPFDPADAVLVKSPFPATAEAMDGRESMQHRARQLYEKVKGKGPERLVAGSDDNTLTLWTPEISKHSICPRMTGHQGVVNDVKFSPDSRLIASASFDHSVKIWDGSTGQFLATMFGHVQDVYLVAWSSDSRLLVSCSRDSTLKLWSVTEVRRWRQEVAVQKSQEGHRKKKKDGDSDDKKPPHQRRRHILYDLPGHADAVYALDWSPDGQRVVSGGKDRVIKMWRS
ncbi:notchless 1 [Echinococcus multilocularis]|uniref:Notchless 1 n=1 Tax=Echinococcus multilocularis TaxID=6211 RepID=A0A068YJT4_ECHMU|nr:notchless 1 [Echinococcus multilocularis]